MKTSTAVYIFPIQSSHQYPQNWFTQAYRVKRLEKNLQGDGSSSVINCNREVAFRMGEEHPDEGGMDDDKE